MYASLCDFCLYRFAFTICPRFLSVDFFFLVYFLVLDIIGELVYWFGCSLPFYITFLNF